MRGLERLGRDRECRRDRRGTTLVELTVMMTIAGVLLTLVVGIAVRQQRVFADLADVSALEGRLREAAALLPVDLRALSPGAGDVRDARDSSLEIRATIATAIGCDTSGSRLILTPAAIAPVGARNTSRYASYSTPILAGDTAWFLSTSDTSDRWTPVPITAVGSAPAGMCAANAPRLDSLAAPTTRVALTLASLASPVTGPSLAGARGAPVRITRPVRYSIYRASDGDWYLGERDWNAALARFNTVQPIAGPFASAVAGGIRFAYLDSSGAAISVPVSDGTRVAAVRIEVRGQTRNIVRALASGALTGRRTDSLMTVVSLRGGR
jgi:hypothetical protein